METKTISAGTVIFKKGETGSCMYELMEGSVGIYADYGLPTQKQLTTLSAGKERFFGEMGLLEAAPRSATAVAETDCKVLTIDAENMNESSRNDPELLLAVMRQMSNRTRALTKDYLEAVRTIAENDHCERSGQSKPDWLRKNLKIFADIWKEMCSTPEQG